MEVLSLLRQSLEEEKPPQVALTAYFTMVSLKTVFPARFPGSYTTPEEKKRFQEGKERYLCINPSGRRAEGGLCLWVRFWL